MKLPCLRFTVRRMMIAVALTALVLVWAIDRARRGYPLVVFEYPRYIENEPLLNRSKVVEFGERGFTLADGRRLRIDNGPWCDARIGWEDLNRVELDVEPGPGDSVTIYTLQKRGVCGTCAANRHVPPIRFRLIPRIEYRNYRALVGTGVMVNRM